MKKWILVLLVGMLLTSCATTGPAVRPTDVPVEPAQAQPQSTAVPVTAAVQPTNAPVEPAQAQPQPTAVPQETEVQPAAAGLDGASILQDKCADCHSPNKVQQSPGDRAHWEQVVNRMVQKGAVLTDAEKQALVDFLASTYVK